METVLTGFNVKTIPNIKLERRDVYNKNMIVHYYYLRVTKYLYFQSRRIPFRIAQRRRNIYTRVL